MRKPPEPRKSASTGKTAAALGFVFVFVLRLDLLLLLHGGLFARNRLKQWRGAVRVLVQQSLSDLRHLESVPLIAGWEVIRYLKAFPREASITRGWGFVVRHRPASLVVPQRA
jgi:hypothetical protein